jgi:DNA helicase-2/ATP-dependent DNA helicase PcrA
MSLAMNWSLEQNDIFVWFHDGRGNLVVQARAGTGKTTTIKHAMTLAPEAKILYAVFNKKNQIEAAAVIKDERVQVKTLHALGFAYLKYYFNKLVRPDDNVENDRIDSVMGENVPGTAKNAVRQLVGFAKNISIGMPTLSTLAAIAEDRNLDADSELPALQLADWALEVMKLSMKPDAQFRISFNDMVWLPVALNLVRPWFNLVVVDEAQDMNAPQLEMAIRACKAGGRICVVGDDRQAIYGFRGAVQDGMEMMRVRLNAQVLGLTTTYRCPQTVVELASSLVPDYKAAPSAPMGSVTRAGRDSFTGKLVPGDAVLSRVNAPLVPLCLELLRNNVPARIEGKDIGKQLLNLVRKMKARSIPEFIKKMGSWLDKLIERVCDTATAEEKIATAQDQYDMLVAIAEVSSGVGDLEARIVNLFQDTSDSPRAAVVFSSTHKAKGLEWPRVFLLQDTYKIKSGPAPVSQESNLYYVAVTRAKKDLVLVETAA